MCSLFLECTDGSGILEWDTKEDRMVTVHESLVGTVSGPPTGDRIIVTDYSNSTAAVIVPQGGLLLRVMCLTPASQRPNCKSFDMCLCTAHSRIYSNLHESVYLGCAFAELREILQVRKNTQKACKESALAALMKETQGLVSEEL